MNTDKATKTLADYLVIVVSPILIMVMVHSLCFFLVEVFYRGEAIGGVRWVLFWSVFAMVLISRMGIEQGDGRAMVYGVALACVTWLYLSSIQPNVVFGAFLLAVVWFTAHKLTCNCTLIDEDADASGQGLLQTIWRLPQKFIRAARVGKRNTLSTERGCVEAQPQRVATFGNAAAGAPFTPHTAALRAREVPPVLAASPKKKKWAGAQTPGVWLIYYSLIALPFFGLGQTLLPAGDTTARRIGFTYLFLYLAAALGLLVSTSFLGLRRYLRQRHVIMPGNIAFGWVRLGVIGVFVVLCLALLMPRPGAGHAWGTLRYHVDYQLRRASEFAARFNPHGTGSGRSGNQPTNGSHPENQPQQNGQASNPGQSKSTSANGQGNQQAGKAPSQPKAAGGHDNSNPQKPLPPLTPPAGAIYPWLKILFWLIVVAGLIWLLFRYRVALLMALRSTWAAILNFFASLFGWLRSTAKKPKPASKSGGVQPFKTFKNPFITGGARIWPPEQLIVYTYDALQSWAMENEPGQGSPQTPREFCRRLGEEMPEAADALAHLAFLYGHVAYGATIPGNYQPDHLRLLWDYLSSPQTKRTTHVAEAIHS